jgi:hypothetical protein
MRADGRPLSTILSRACLSTILLLPECSAGPRRAWQNSDNFLTNTTCRSFIFPPVGRFMREFA